MNELDHIVVANKAKIPCTLRTLKPFWVADERKPWVHFGEIADAILYLAVRTELPDAEIHALKEQLEKLSCSISVSSGSPDHPQVVETAINEQ